MRLDYVVGKVEIDTSPQDVTAHGTSKAAVEADALAVLSESFRRGRVRLVPGADAAASRYTEIEGAADPGLASGSPWAPHLLA